MRVFKAIILLYIPICLATFSFVVNSKTQLEHHEIAYQFAELQNIPFTQIIESKSWLTTEDGWIKESFNQLNYWFGPQPKVVWVKITPVASYRTENSPSLDNSFPDWIELASSGVSAADLFIQNDNSWQHISQKKALSTQQNTRFLSFKMQSEWFKKTLYLRVEASDKFHLQLNFYSDRNFLNKQIKSNLVFFICYGILLVMMIYNLIIGRFLKDKLYYLYALAIGSTLAYQILAHGHIRLLFLPDWDLANRISNIFAMLSALTAFIFLYYFASFEKYAPKVAKYTAIGLKVFAIGILISIFLPSNLSLNIALLLAGPTPLFGMLTAAWVWYKGSVTAKIFFLAWIAYIIGGTLWVVYWFGIITLTDSVELPLAIGAALESILLSLALGYRIQLLQREHQSLTISHNHYKQISLTDSLTQVANRRAFDQFLEELLLQKQPFGLILLDIDYFKTFNDTYGHPAGDKVLIALGQILKSSIREGDLAARIGGEEFAIIIINHDIKVTYDTCERIRKQFSNAAFSMDKNTVYCSLSAGIAFADTKEQDANTLIQKADQALYLAKHQGRNQTQVAEQPDVVNYPFDYSHID